MAAPANLNFAQKTSTSVPAEQKINVFFDWKGPTSTFKGKLYCGVVDLVIEGAKTEISVSIPEQNGSDTVQRLAFTLRKNPGTFLL